MASMTPIFHFNPEGCDDSRLDQRPIIYATDWSYQFEILDERVRELARVTTRKIEDNLGKNVKLVISPETIPPILVKKTQVEDSVSEDDDKRKSVVSSSHLIGLKGNETSSSFQSMGSSRINGSTVTSK
jgi:hypothetical protein